MIEYEIKELDQGADDYISKPVDVNELIPRLHEIEKRLSAVTSSTITGV